jgi:uncharacterized membrane protein
MKYCSKCGAKIEDESLKFCPQCGNNLQGEVSPTPSPSVGLEDNIAALLCYLGGFITGIIFLMIEPYNRKPIIRFHAFQSIFYNVALFILMVIFGILSWIFIFIGIARIFFAFTNLVWILAIILWILLMVWAYQNKKIVLPIIGALAEKQASQT